VKHTKKGLLVGAVIIGALSLSGCATKKYVDREVLRVDTLAQGTQSQLETTRSEVGAKNSAQDQQLASLDTATREALERATAAGKLAEGKFLYSMVLSDDSVKFPLNKYQLSPQAQARLDELVQKLKAENKNVYVEIQGHTDASGPPTYNERLGEERAEAVRRYLAKNGVALNRLATISYGEEMPVADNKTRDGRAQNRRVVLVVLS
jgi:peptidoglycan-associated lipoprotein